MRVAFFDTHNFERHVFEELNVRFNHSIHFLEPRLAKDTARLARGFDVACSFANDHVDRQTLDVLKQEGIKLIATRSAGFNHIDLRAAKELGLPVVRVPEYSPYAVAEHTVGLMLSLNRKIHRAYQRVKEFNFTLDGLEGFDMRGKTVGIIGTGRIGSVVARILRGFGCKILAHDIAVNEALARELDVHYVPLGELYKESMVITLHLPLTPQSQHLLNENAISQMPRGVMIINTSRGAVIDTTALVAGLKSGHIGMAGLDVYEEEEGVFFENLSECGLKDDVLARLLTFPNVLITSHQAFLTREALTNIATTTLKSISDFAAGLKLENQISI